MGPDSDVITLGVNVTNVVSPGVTDAFANVAPHVPSYATSDDKASAIVTVTTDSSSERLEICMERLDPDTNVFTSEVALFLHR